MSAINDSPDAALRVLIIDDHSLLVEALRLSLGTAIATNGAVTPLVEIHVAPCLDLAAVLDQARLEQPDIILVDLDLGEGRAGVDLIAPLTSAGHRVLLFTGSTSTRELGAGLQAGATGIVRKTDPFDRLVGGISDAARGQNTMRPAEREAIIEEFQRSRAVEIARDARTESLTPRERAVLDQLASGATPSQIAATTFVSIATVRSHIKSILRKLGVSSQLAAVAVGRGD